jgi:hypothetical protein
LHALHPVATCSASSLFTCPQCANPPKSFVVSWRFRKVATVILRVARYGPDLKPSWGGAYIFAMSFAWSLARRKATKGPSWVLERFQVWFDVFPSERIPLRDIYEFFSILFVFSGTHHF